MQTQKTSGQATASLILGILSFILLGIFAAIPAIICGHIAKKEIKANPKYVIGDGQATAGLVLGYLNTVFSLIMIVGLLAATGIPSFLKARQATLEKNAINNARIVMNAIDEYAIKKGLPDNTPVSVSDIEPYLQCGVDDLRIRLYEPNLTGLKVNSETDPVVLAQKMYPNLMINIDKRSNPNY